MQNFSSISRIGRSKSGGGQNFGYCLNFSNDTHRVDCGTDFLGTGNLSVAMWVKPTTITNAETLLTNGTFIMMFVVNNALRVYSDGATAATGADSGVVTGQWQHVAITRTSAGVTNLYINGILSGTANQSSGTPGAASTNVFLGNRGAADRGLDSLVDSVMVFGRILSAAEIMTLYSTNFVSRTGLQAEYLFSSGTGNVVDTSGNGHTGTITGATYVASGHY